MTTIDYQASVLFKRNYTSTATIVINQGGTSSGKSLDGDIKSSFLHTISILVAEAAADGKLTWSDGVYLLEWYYQHKYKSAE